MKGVTCQHIESMGTDIFFNAFKFFEMNLHLLSPYQVKPKEDFVYINILPNSQAVGKLEFS